MRCIDLKSNSHKRHTFPRETPGGMIYEYWKNFVCASDGFYTAARISSMCKKISRQLQNKKFFLLGSIFMYGICAANIQGKSSGYRNMFESWEKQIVSYGASRRSGEKHFGKCKQHSGLENLCGFCADTDSKSPGDVCKRKFWDRAAKHSIRFGCDSNRFMPFPVSMGKVSQDKSRRKNAHSSGSAWEYSDDNYCYSGEYSRSKNIGRIAFRAVGNLYYGPRLFGLFASLCHSKSVGIFCDTSKSQFGFQAFIFSADRQNDRNKIRSNRDYGWILFEKTLSLKTSAHRLCRCRKPQPLYFSYQQYEPSGGCNCRSLQIAVAGRTFFQMDKTAFENQGVLWDIRECRKDSNLDCNFGVCSDSHHKKATQFKAVTLHNSTDFKCCSIRENPYFTSIFGGSLC